MPPKTVSIASKKLASNIERQRAGEHLQLGARVIGKLKAHGSTMTMQALHTNGVYFDTPERKYIAEYEGAYRNDPYIRDAFDKVTGSMLASLGEYMHKDPRAVEYVKNLDREMDGNLRQSLGEAILGARIAGYSVSEMVLKPKDNLVYLESIDSYHPLSIHVVPNKAGKLTEGETDAAHPHLKTGIWQRLPMQMRIDKTAGTSGFHDLDYVNLPLESVLFLCHAGRYGNIMGESQMAPVWKRLESVYELIRGLLITTERYGSPQVAVTVPKSNTNEEIDDGNGNTVFKSLAQKVSEGMAELNSSTGIVVEEPVGLPGNPQVRFTNISSFNNFSEVFLGSLKFFYRDILVGLGIPPLLVLEQEGGLGNGTLSKIHAEMYKQLITAMYKEFVEPFTTQVIGRLLKLNFGIEDPGYFEFNPFDLSAAETLMLVFGEASDHGLLDFSIEEDLQMGRTKLGLPRASAETIQERIKNNKDLMQAKRRPDVDKVKIANIRAKGTIDQAYINQETQTKTAGIQARTTIQAAKLRPSPKPPSAPSKK